MPGVCAISVRAFGEGFASCPEPEFSLPGVRELPALSFELGLLLRWGGEGGREGVCRGSVERLLL